jgi:hypothetical protein
MKEKLKKYLLIAIAVLAFILLAYCGYKMLNKEKKPVIDEVKEEDTIQTKEFDYVLYDNKSEIYKEYFKKLKEELLKEEVNDDEYAKIISELFVIDFYSLADKRTSTDIGGLDFIEEEEKENFVLNATNTIYKYVESNVYGDRKQELPKITAVEIKEATKTPIKFEKAQDEFGYKVVVTITYEKDLGYAKEITLSLVHKESKLYIVDVKEAK